MEDLKELIALHDEKVTALRKIKGAKDDYKRQLQDIGKHRSFEARDIASFTLIQTLEEILGNTLGDEVEKGNEK